MVISAIIVFGVVSFREIGIDLFPRVEFPVITIVSVPFPGADPATIETTVTDPIEEAVSRSRDQAPALHQHRRRLAGGDRVRAGEGTSTSPTRRSRPSSARSARTCRTTSRIRSSRSSTSTRRRSWRSIVSRATCPIRDLTHLADKTVKERLQRVRNVGAGEDRRRPRPADLALARPREARGRTALGPGRGAPPSGPSTSSTPAGASRRGRREYVVKTKAEFESAEQIADMVVAYRDGAPVRVRDLGRVEDGLEEERSSARA